MTVLFLIYVTFTDLLTKGSVDFPVYKYYIVKVKHIYVKINHIGYSKKIFYYTGLSLQYF